MFPFYIKLKKTISISSLGADYRNEILEFFEVELNERKADNLKIEENVLIFRNHFFKLNNLNIMAPIDKGEVKVQEASKNFVKVQYQFSLRITLLFGAIAGFSFFLISKEWNVGLFAFLWLGGMNWLTAAIRHYIMFNDLIKKLTKR
jgi:hypothetical protein